MTKTTNLFLFLAIAAILIASPLVMGEAFAKDHKEPKPPKEPKEPKLKNNDIVAMFAALWDVIAGLQTQIAGIELTSDLGDTYRVTGSDQGSGQTIEAKASCDEGDILLSCGFFKASSSVTINGVAPFPETQSCIAFAIVSGGNVESVSVFALCADTDPPHENDD